MSDSETSLFFRKILSLSSVAAILFLSTVFFPTKTFAQEPPPEIVTPTLYCLGSCPTTAPETVTNPTTVSQKNSRTSEANIVATGDPDTSVAPTEAPCEPGTVSTQTWGHHGHKKSSEGAIGSGMTEFLQLLTQLLELIMQLLGGGSPTLPTPDEATPTTTPTTGTEEPTTQPEEPCVSPTTVGQNPTQTAPTTVQPTVAATVPPGTGTSPTKAVPGTTAAVKITFYGSYDNDPKGSLAIANPVIHQEAGGTGTFEDPLTFASPAGDGEYPFGTKIYVPMVQKYFIREDECAVSWTAPNGCGEVTMVDLYVGNPSSSEAVVACENSLTQDYDQNIVVNPPDGLSVDPQPIWNQATGKCMTPHL